MAQTKIPAGLLDKSAHVDFADNEKLRLGTSQDLEIFHDGTHSFIQDSGNGDIIIYGTGEDLAKFKDDGAVELYYNGTKTLETISGGASVIGNLAVSGNLTVSGTTAELDTTNLNVTDKNITLNYHASSDTSSNADGAGITIQDAVNASTNATILWNASSDQFDFSHHIKVPDSKYLKMGNDNDFIIYHDGTTNYIQAVKQDSDIIFRGNDGGTNFNAMVIDMSAAGKVGIGTAAPSTPVHVVKVGNPNGGNRNTVEDVLTLEATGYYPYTGYGVGINFQGEDYGNTAIRDYGKIQAVMEGNSAQTAAGDAGFTSQLAFWTNSGGASNTVSTQKMAIKADGKVGIGTNAPQQLLDIKGTAPNIRFTDDRQITWVGTEKLGGVEWFTSDTSANGTLTGASIYCENSVGSTLPNFNMVFATQVHNNASAPIERMRISSDGNVGIGTDSPVNSSNYKTLDIRGSTGGQILAGRGSYQDFFMYTTSTGANIGALNNLAFKAGTTGSMSTPSLYLKDGGNVGIGTDNPSYKLHLSGAIADQSPLILGTVTGTPPAAFNWVAEYMAASLPQDRRIVIALGKARSTNNSATISYIQRADANDNAIAFGHFGANDLVNFTYNGRVGIGTTTPEAVLDVTASIDASIRQSSTYNYAPNRNWAIRTNNFGSANWGGWSLETSTGAFGTPSVARIGVHANGNVGIGIGGAAGTGGTENPEEKLHVGGNIKTTRQLLQGNSNGTPRTINIPYASAGSGFSFNWDDLADYPTVGDQTSEKNAFMFEVNVTSYLFRRVKALIIVDTNSTNSIAVHTIHSSTLTCSATIPTGSETITVTIGGLWGNAVNYMGRITTF